MLLLRTLLLIVLLPGVFCFSTRAAVDVEAARVLDAVGNRLSAARTAEVDLRLQVKTPTAPQGEDLAADYKLSVERPNRMALVLQKGNLGATVVSDGTNVTTLLPKPGVFTVEKASGRIGAMEAAGPAGDMGSMAFITALFSTNVRSALLAGVSEAKYAGREKVGDVECERLEMKQEGLGWRLFATTGANAVVRRIEVAIPQLSMSMDFTAWKLNAAVPAERFIFVAPEGARKVASFSEKEEGAEGEDSDLVDDPLPRLKLKTVDGANFDTATFKGSVTLLVVWAGDQEHCGKAIKAVVDLGGGYKNVNFVSINVDEKPDRKRIKEFVAKQKIVLPIAVDESGEAIDKLEIEGVPMTFLIDKSGVVRKAFLGYHTDFKTILEKELRALLK